eukprot:c11244_g1_i2.p1 GENE.c11244_g1_i2~~c11244_g1_i2.p1  ORF type:complete len:211 (-),score=18.57 c11244_g1_i2:382-1014(-)
MDDCTFGSLDISSSCAQGTFLGGMAILSFVVCCLLEFSCLIAAFVNWMTIRSRGLVHQKEAIRLQFSIGLIAFLRLCIARPMFALFPADSHYARKDRSNQSWGFHVGGCLEFFIMIHCVIFVYTFLIHWCRTINRLKSGTYGPGTLSFLLIARRAVLYESFIIFTILIVCKDFHSIASLCCYWFVYITNFFFMYSIDSTSSTNKSFIRKS